MADRYNIIIIYCCAALWRVRFLQACTPIVGSWLVSVQVSVRFLLFFTLSGVRTPSCTKNGTVSLSVIRSYIYIVVVVLFVVVCYLKVEKNAFLVIFIGAAC